MFCILDKEKKCRWFVILVGGMWQVITTLCLAVLVTKHPQANCVGEVPLSFFSII